MKWVLKTPVILPLMYQMDDELKRTTLSQSFENVPKRNGPHHMDTEDDQVDENLNLVKNFLESYSGQDGRAGPVTNLLSHLQGKLNH